MINPIELKGNWTEGFALDVHVVESIYIGENEYGHPEFDTIRSEIGELIYQLKYRNNNKVIYDIMDLMIPFLKWWNIRNKIDLIIPVPPSNKNRIQQPVFKIAEAISIHLKKPISYEILEKINEEQVKNIDRIDRGEAIKGSIIKKKYFKRNVKILLVDDLYRTGSTLQEVCNVLKGDKYVRNIYVLTMTKTKR